MHNRLDLDEMEWDDDDDCDDEESLSTVIVEYDADDGQSYEVEFNRDTFHDALAIVFGWGQDPEMALTSLDAAKFCQFMRYMLDLCEVVG